jgi:hypothetical protein
MIRIGQSQRPVLDVIKISRDLIPSKVIEFAPWLINAIALRTLEQLHGHREAQTNQG